MSSGSTKNKTIRCTPASPVQAGIEGALRVKRLFDLMATAAGLVVLSPLFGLVAILIKVDSRGPVFFMQERIGRAFRPFFIYKFRTMVHDAPGKGLQITAGGDSRITKIGRILRKTKIDELPQLINVFKGDMSLVGPRPEVGKYVEHYKKEYEVILSVRPGITDISSMTFRNEEGLLQGQKDPELFYLEVLLPEKMRLAREYIQHRNFFYDINLIVKTFYRILVPHDDPGVPMRTRDKSNL
jgi:lipopolysaccharide/colanic/teichoic acid biosynthesis glycosyltransferase